MWKGKNEVFGAQKEWETLTTRTKSDPNISTKESRKNSYTHGRKTK